MEQRVQSMVCCISLVQQVLRKQPEELQISNPLVVYSPAEALSIAWTKFMLLPTLIDNHLRVPIVADTESRNDSTSTPGSGSRLSAVINSIEVVLREQPKTYNAMRLSCIALRNIVLSIADLSTGTARLPFAVQISIHSYSFHPTIRLNQLADILALWANTTNFSYAQVTFKHSI